MVNKKRLSANPPKTGDVTDRVTWLRVWLEADITSANLLVNMDVETFLGVQRRAHDLLWEWTRTGVIGKGDFKRCLDSIKRAGYREAEVDRWEDE